MKWNAKQWEYSQNKGRQEYIGQDLTDLDHLITDEVVLDLSRSLLSDKVIKNIVEGKLGEVFGNFHHLRRLNLSYVDLSSHRLKHEAIEEMESYIGVLVLKKAKFQWPDGSVATVEDRATSSENAYDDLFDKIESIAPEPDESVTDDDIEHIIRKIESLVNNHKFFAGEHVITYSTSHKRLEDWTKDTLEEINDALSFLEGSLSFGRRLKNKVKKFFGRKAHNSKISSHQEAMEAIEEMKKEIKHL